MKMITAAVNSLENMDSLIQALADMGARHVAYSVKDEDYDKVGAALLWTLEQGLGPVFNEEVKAAWIITYTTVADIMKQGANAHS